MNWFSDLTVYRKLAVGFGSILVILAISSGFIFQKSREVASITRMNAVSDLTIDLLDQADAALTRLPGSLSRYLITHRPEDSTAIQDDETQIMQKAAQLRAILGKEKPESLGQIDAYIQIAKRYIDEAAIPQARLAANPARQADAMASIISRQNNQLLVEQKAASRILERTLRDWSDAWTAKALATTREIAAIVAGSAVLGSIIALGVAWFIARSIGAPLASMTEAMQILAGGDLTIEIPARKRRDEIGHMASAVQVFKDSAQEKRTLEAETRLAQKAIEAEREKRTEREMLAAEQQNTVLRALATGLGHMAEGNLTEQIITPFSQEYEQLRIDFNAAQTALRRALAEVSAKASGISASVTEVGSASDDLSRRTEQQAAALEQTAGTLELITRRVEGTARGSAEMRRSTRLASDEASRSSVVVDDTMQAMSRIEASSTEIGQIIGVIDDIAMQTNLLALNASIEAARAGDAGRGFALVASEVRTLAQRSANAASQVKDLISRARTEVSSGVVLAREVGSALQRIVTQIGAVTLTVGEIASSCEEQASGLAQVNTAIGELDRATQQNAAMVEQNTSAVLSLGKNTSDLTALVGRFKTAA
ncbi:HAMP domain-containing protein [Asaia siamensis]|uniref:Chemotaxis protein n=1 Tax=Asaia siamensis TaxID=110479 RepID=A0ABQ1LEV9_9PROT|nr:methyl-accepting chemotaxis protein [Asaia siamensis]GBR08097.1 methyl-accepting chemotaxis protein [Asaia siamensis NRIC 0323]GGC23636.1 chemotaxis protein [Asaia siamensis]